MFSGCNMFLSDAVARPHHLLHFFGGLRPGRALKSMETYWIMPGGGLAKF
jgi:hypothetical protein